MQANAVAFQTSENAQEREIRLCRRLVEPLHSVRPRAVVDHIR